MLRVLLNAVAVERMITHEAKPSALSFLETAMRSIISVVYERKWYFNWLVARSTSQDQSKLAR